MMLRIALTSVFVCALPLLTTSFQAHAHHEAEGHRGPTYKISPPAPPDPNSKHLRLRILDNSGDFTAARISIKVNGQPFTPHAVNKHGLRFVSIHTAKEQRATVIYARGTGPVSVSLPADTRRGEIVVTKGYEFLPSRAAFKISDQEETSVTVRLNRWSTVRDNGWMAADEHLHYERIDPRHDADWLDMLAADGLSHACFMVLKGGNLPGVWAKQYAYGEEGQATDGRQLIVPGEEFRGRRQGHINLLGLGDVIRPISIGGLGKPSHSFNYPALHDVLLKARRSGGIGGPAHGGALARNSTAVVDTVLGAADFFEIANTHLYKTDVWYRLMNCGFILPPAAGTDLPNYPFRDSRQPLLGETRMYVRVGKKRDFESWKRAIRSGKVFISSGPIVQFKINGVGPGGVVQLPAGGGDLEIQAELSCAQPLQSFEIVRNGMPLGLRAERRHEQGVHRWRIAGRVEVNESCWLAARGAGALKAELARHTGIRQNAVAHTAAVKVIVNNQPITSPDDAAVLVKELTAHQQAYRTEGTFRRVEDRMRLLQLFDRAIKRVESEVREQ